MQARREKLDALDRARHRAVRLRDSTLALSDARRSRRCRRASVTRRDRASASPVVSSRGARTARPSSRTSPTQRRASSSTSARTSSATSVSRLVELLDLGDVVGVSGPAVPHAHGRGHRARGVGRAARQVAAAAPVRQGRGRRRRDGAGTPGSPIRSSAIASATRISRCIPRCARCFVARSRMVVGDPRRISTDAGLPRGRDAGAAAAVRRRGGAAVRDAPQRARTCRSICASPTSCT